MPETRPESSGTAPPEVVAYDAAIHGAGHDGIIRWRELALQWLRDHPGQSLPDGLTDWLAVRRRSVKLRTGLPLIEPLPEGPGPEIIF